MRVYEGFGRIDTSVGWNVWNHNVGFVATLLNPTGAERVWSGAGEPVLANCTSLGRAVVVAGGLRVSGSWPMVSGVDSADWLLALCVVLDGDRRRVTGQDGGEYRFVLFSRAQLTVHDTWNVSGMRASGSKKVQVDDVFVAEDLSVDVATRPRCGGPLYRIPTMYLMAAGCTAVLLGTAQGAIDELVELAPGKKTFEGGTLADRPATQDRIGRAETALRAARGLLFLVATQFDRAAEAGDPITLELRSSLHAAQSHSASVSREVLVSMHERAGSTSVYLGSRFERLIRDGLVATQHLNHSARFFEDVGRIRLGMAPQIPLF